MKPLLGPAARNRGLCFGPRQLAASITQEPTANPRLSRNKFTPPSFTNRRLLSFALLRTGDCTFYMLYSVTHPRDRYCIATSG